MIVHEEMARWGARGTATGLLGGINISVPTVLNFGTQEMKTKVIRAPGGQRMHTAFQHLT